MPTVRQALRAQVIERSGGVCEWNRCVERGDELAHLHSIGMGGRKSADTLTNVMWLCWDHARISDGLYATGGLEQYRRAHLDIGVDLMGVSVAWSRAEALRESITTT